MKNISLLLFAFLLVFTFTGCKTKNAKEQGEKKKDTLTVQKIPGNEASHRFEIKSGLLILEQKMMNMKQTIYIYWDDFGDKKLTEVTTEMMGNKVHQENFVKDGYLYNLNMDKKSGSKMKLTELNPNTLNFRDIPDSIRKAWKIIDEGKEKFMDKECEKYSIDYKSKMGTMKGIYYIWKGLPLKTVMNMGNMQMITETKELKENTPFPEDKYAVPSGFKIEEIKEIK